MTASAQTTRAVLMAGGKGTRLRPLTAVLPKPIVPIGDKPILQILMEQLRENGFRDVTVCTGYLAELIMVVAGDGSKYGMNVSYHPEDKPLGTAGALGDIKDLTDPFIVMNGDLLTTLSYKRMLEYHVQEQADLTIAIYQRDVKIDFGVVELDSDNGFTGFKEKPTYPMHVSMGVNVLSKGVLEHVAPNEYLDMPDLVKKVHESGGKVACFKDDCYWLDIGRLDDYALAQEHYEKNRELFSPEGGE